MSDALKCCENCGQDNPTYQVYDINGVCLGCETCLTIKKEGAIQI